MSRMTEFKDGNDIDKLAENMADTRIKYLHSIGMGKGISNTKHATEEERKAFNDLADKYYDFLKNTNFPEEYLRDDKFTVQNYIDMVENKKSPEDFIAEKKQKDFEIDANKTLYEQMSNEEIAALAAKYGYDWSKVEDRVEFMDQVRKQGEINERAKVVKDFEDGKDMGGYDWTGKFGSIAASMAYPTATDEARKQALTGDYDDSKLIGSMLLDGATQTAQMFSPAGGFKLAGIQGLSEVARQGVQEGTGLGDGDFNLSPALQSFLAGATTPGLKLGSAGIISKFGGPGQKISRGIQETTRGTPLEMEQKAAEGAYKRGARAVEKGEIPSSVTDWESKGKWDNAKDDVNVYYTFKSIDTTPEEFFKNPNKFTQQEVQTVEQAVGSYGTNKLLPKDKKPIMADVPTGELTEKNEKLRNLLPETYRNVIDSKDNLKKAGIKLGYALEGIGGRAEPAYLVNPATILGSAFQAKLPDDMTMYDNTNPLEEQEWFQKLSPKSQEIIKKVMEEKSK